MTRAPATALARIKEGGRPLVALLFLAVGIKLVVALSLFQALAEETRLEIVALLSGGERCVCELQDELDAAQSRLSFHLRKLKDAGLVSDRRQGRWVYYALVPEALEELSGFLHAMEPQHGWSRPATRSSACCETNSLSWLPVRPPAAARFRSLAIARISPLMFPRCSRS